MDMTQFDKKPEGMINYLQYNGPHFNEKLCKFAVSKMTKKINGQQVPITPFILGIMYMWQICVKLI